MCDLDIKQTKRKDAGRKRPHGRRARRLLYLFVSEMELLAVVVGIRHAFQLGKGLLGQRPHIPVHIRQGGPDVGRRSCAGQRKAAALIFEPPPVK